MQYEYSKEHEITYSETNKKLELGLHGIINLTQDVSTKYFQTFGSDNYTNSTKNNAVWVLAKTRVNIIKRPRWTENIKCVSRMTVSKMVRVSVETVFYDQNDEILVIVVQESCPMDLETRKVRKIDTISYPEDMEIAKANLENPFSKLTEDFNDDNFVYTRKIETSDIDFSNHANNASYIRYLMNALPSTYWENKTIEDFEIHYINECKEDEEISIYAKEENNIVSFLIKNKDNEIIVKSKVKYKKGE